MNEQRLARTFVELADTLVEDFDVVEFLQLLVERAVELLEVSAAGLLLADAGGRLHMMAISTEAVRVVELFQQQNDQGPCLDCYRTGEPIEHSDLATATDRWPRFAPVALDAGFRSVHALPMRLRTEVLGAFTLFHNQPDTLEVTTTKIGQVMVDVATIGLIQERSGRRRETLIDQLQRALDNRVLIEQAKGALAERHGIDPAEAFTLLRGAARRHGHKLTELAAAVLDGTASELLTTAPSPGPPAV